MRSLVLIAACLLLNAWVAVASAQPVPTAPKPPPSPKSLGLPDATSPMLGFFQGYDAKEKKVKLAFIDSMPDIVEKKVKKNGKEEIEYEETFKPFVIANGVPLADISFYNAQGQKLKAESVLATLKTGDTLVVSGDEKPIQAAYLKVIKADAIIAIFPLDAFLAPLIGDVFPPPPPGEAIPAPLGPVAPPAPAPPAPAPRTPPPRTPATKAK
jgi:hypothetical protein